MGFKDRRQRFSKWRTYLIRLGKWLLPPPLSIVPIMTLLLAFLCLAAGWPLERELRFAGGVLQLGGVILTGIDLHQKGLVFDDLQSFWRRIGAWWSRRPRWRPKAHVLSATGLSFGVSLGKSRPIRKAGPKASIEQRLNILEESHYRLFDELTALERETEKHLAEIEKTYRQGHDELKKQSATHEERLRKSIAEGIPFGWIGVVLFFVGILVSAIAPEVACWFTSGCIL